VFAGGSFTNIGGRTRSRIAALDRATGLALAWNPSADGNVFQLSPAGSVIYAGGEFVEIGGQLRRGLAMLDVISGKATGWDPQSGGDAIRCLSVNGSQLFAAGPLPRGGRFRSNLAAIDARTGEILDWNPGADQPVYALALAGDVVYAGGNFMNIGGVSRIRVAAINAADGTVPAWNTATVGPNGRVEAISVSADFVFAVGGFTSVGTMISPGAAAFSRASGQITAWKPFANRPVRAVLVSDNVVYSAGSFSSIGGQPRSCFAALDSATGSALPWNPNALGTTVAGLALARSGDVIYAGGSFTDIGGQLRLHLAALDIDSGTATAWNPGIPSLNDSVQRIAVANGVVYVTGSFNTIGGLERRELAAVDAGTAEVLPWNPDPAGPAGTPSVSTLEASANAVYVGGNFTELGGRRRSYFAAFPMDGVPQILRQPAPAHVARGQPVALTVDVSGQQPLFIQWQLNGTNLSGATGTNLVLASAQAGNSGSYSVIITNQLGYTRSLLTTLTVAAPLEIVSHPANQSVAPGNDVNLIVEATGGPAPFYQWKLNGAPIPGATSATLSLTNVQPSDSGRYSVVVFNGAEILESQTATVVVSAPGLAFADNFIDRVAATSAAGVGAGSNATATSENAQGEPAHAGKPGGRSVWYSWIAPATGLATFSTRGSDFDTLLAAYTFSLFGGLIGVAADDDSGGFRTSMISFKAVAGTRYEIAIDGYFGRTGRIVLHWSLESTADPLPRILVHPTSQTVTIGDHPTLLVIADNSLPLGYQWYRNGASIEGQTNVSLTIDDFQTANVGLYSVVVGNGLRSVESAGASLEIGPVAAVVSQDKLEDLFFAGTSGARFISLALGSESGQIFHNAGASTQAGEPNPCGGPGGSSRWMRIRPAEFGTLLLDTVGSEIDTALAVFTGTNIASLVSVACDNNGALDGARSQVRFDVAPGIDYLVSVDGINGAQGNIRLNWKLGTAPLISASTTNFTVRLGATLTLTVTSSNAIPPATYAWRLDGQVIPGATSTSLNLTNLQSSQSGTYSVIASNIYGAVTNIVALVTVAAPVQLKYELISTNGDLAMRIMGPIINPLTLEATDNLTNWVPLQTMDAVIPLDIIDPAFGEFPRRFYRGLITPVAGIRYSWFTNGGRQIFRLRGPVNQSLIVEASTNFSSWQPLHTNAVAIPLDFIDFDSTNSAKRFYRLR
jgi:hypothetical protein